MVVSGVVSKEALKLKIADQIWREKGYFKKQDKIGDRIGNFEIGELFFLFLDSM